MQFNSDAEKPKSYNGLKLLATADDRQLTSLPEAFGTYKLKTLYVNNNDIICCQPIFIDSRLPFSTSILLKQDGWGS